MAVKGSEPLGGVKRLHPLALGIDSRVRANWVIRRAAVNPVHRYCYFRLPKCANSTVIKTLFRNDSSLGDVPESANFRTMKKHFSGLFRARAWSPRDLTAKYFCFTVVRNPFTRVLSAYLDKVAAANAGQYRYVAEFAGVEEACQVSFPDFVSFLESGGLFANPHWAPQTSLIPLDSRDLAFVGRVENLEVDLRQLINRLFGEGSFKGVSNRADRRRGSDIKVSDFYSPDLIDRVFRLYWFDFEEFGYSINLE